MKTLNLYPKLGNVSYFSAILLSFLALLSCDQDKPNFNFSHLPKQKILQIPTYDGSCQAMHPDIIFFENGLDGHYFIMAFTPYPFSRNQYENPSVVVSDNGTDFYEEAENLNPVAKKPPGGYNNDPDILYDPLTDAFYLYYNETLRPDSQNLFILYSKDRIVWERQAKIHYDFKKAKPFILSPACIYTESGYYLFYVNASEKKRPIQFLVSTDCLDWNPDSIHSTNYSFPMDIIPWHIDIFRYGDNYYMLVCAPYPNTDLYLAESSDLINWEFHQKPIIDHNDTFFGPCDRVYRSSGVIIEDILAIWFSFRRLDGSWGIAIQKFDLHLLFEQEVN